MEPNPPIQQNVDNQSIELQKRSSGNKILFFKNKNGEEKKDDMPAQKSLIISIPNKDIRQISKESHLRSSSSEVLEPDQKNLIPRILKRQQTGTKEVQIEMKKDYDVDELKSYEPQVIDKRRIRSKGFSSLQSYLYEMKNENTDEYVKAQKNRSRQNKAKLVVMGNDSISDEESEEDFKMKINQLLNRLTEDTIKQVLNELIPQINTFEKEKFVTEIFVEKVSLGKRFASIYADFVKEIPKSHSTLAQSIINSVADRLEDYTLNPPDELNYYDCESSIGYATFVAFLISNGKIEYGERYLKDIIDYIPENSINPILIEMLNCFVVSVGQAFIQKVDKQIFEKLKLLSEKKDIQSRAHYLIVDTLKIINGINAEETNQIFQKEIENLKEENSVLNQDIIYLKEENSVLNQDIIYLDKDNSVLNSELKKKIKHMEYEITRKEEVQNKQLRILGSEEMKSYKKGKRIGRGSTSEVYEVIQETKLAMKVLDLEMMRISKKDDDNDESDDDEKHQELDIEQAKKFLQESEVLNSLEDEHIIKTYGFFFGDEEEGPAIILEYCESNLKKRIKKLINEERIQIIVDIISAMNKVHSKGIIHRDLKLENILLDTNNRAKLSDFGLCTFIKDDDETMSHTSMAGSLKYMSPELLQGRRDYDEKILKKFLF